MALSLALALLTFCRPSVCAATVRQGFSPFGIALTRDGRFAYLSFDLSASVFRVRLSDMAVVATADLSRYFSMECESLVLDAGERKLFLLDHTGRRLIVLDAATLQEIRSITGLGNVTGAQLVRSRHGPYLILTSPPAALLVNTETYEVTTVRNPRLAFFFIRENTNDPSLWYALARDGAGVVIGTYDYKADRWSPKATIQPREGEWGHHDFAVLPDGRKAYVAVLGPWLPDYHAAGWVLPTGMAVS